MSCSNCSKNLVTVFENGGLCERIPFSNRFGKYCSQNCRNRVGEKEMIKIIEKGCFLCKSFPRFEFRCGHLKIHLCSEDCVNTSIERIRKTRTAPRIEINTLFDATVINTLFNTVKTDSQ